MRRATILMALFAVGLTNLGCKHTAGKCDWTHDPANTPMPPVANPYIVAGPTLSGAGAAAPAETVPSPAPVPPKTSN